MKKFYYFSAVVTMAVTMLCGTSCQEEEVKVSNGDLTNGKKSEVINKDSVLTIDGKRMEWNINITPQKKSISKGLAYNREYYEKLENECKETYGKDYDLFKTITYNHRENGNVTPYNIHLMRIDRKSEPGKYFYVMTSNLKVELDTACWAYGQTEHVLYTLNANKYGRLYTWDAANALAKKIRIRLPRYDKNNPSTSKGEKLISARLLSIQDVNDIIECDNIGYNGYSIDDCINDAPCHEDIDEQFFYYDVFLGGIDGPNTGDIDYSRGEKSLGGFRDTKEDDDYYALNKLYYRLNEYGYFWLMETSHPWEAKPAFHRTFEITYNKKSNYTAVVNTGHLNQYGYSVRYVFEPEYK